MRRRTYLTAAAATLIGVGGCFAVVGDDDPEDRPNVGGQAGTPTRTDTPTAVIGFIEHEWTVIEEYESDAVDDTYGVRGRAVNNADAVADVFIEATFYDDDETQIGDSIDNANGVKPGSEFTFELPYLEDDPDAVADYELTAEAYEA